MLSVTHKKDLLNACRILFGPAVQLSIDFLRDLEPSKLKSAYRKRAFETHPDRANLVGKSEGEYFIELGGLSSREMDEMIERMRDHNMRAFWTK